MTTPSALSPTLIAIVLAFIGGWNLAVADCLEREQIAMQEDLSELHSALRRGQARAALNIDGAGGDGTASLDDHVPGAP